MPDNEPDILPFNEAFLRSKARPISYRNQTVHWGMRVPVDINTRLCLHVVKREIPPPEQALLLFGERCRVCINGQQSRNGTLWVSEWEQPINISFRDVRGDASLLIRNATSAVIGASTNDWGNYGVIIHEVAKDSKWLLNFSQGLMPRLPDFSALVVQLSVIRTALDELPAESGP